MRTFVRDLAGLALHPPAARLDHGNVTEALSAAGELEHVGLVEARELCLLLCDRAPEKYGRATLRWHGGYCREVRDVTLEEAQAVLATLALLPTVRERGASALSDLLYRRGLERAGEALNAWAVVSEHVHPGIASLSTSLGGDEP